ncbi:ATP-grasp domain-containing protein [Propioniciclava sp. MC1683]|uniref:ATP-grasp domain-containing protein n=1 Tax=Propioniciclava sp. MC1683 TaxID=2760309 RepID=UPI0021046F65|nr:ATP-grasp domain-containing protein [Propioniciclava sp. MC1683]
MGGRMNARDALVRRLSDALGPRRLIWAGLRGSDAESLVDLPQFDASFTILDAYQRRPLTYGVAYESFTGERPDMERWDIDEHLEDPASREFRHGLLTAMGVESALLPYRPSSFLSSLWFARKDRCLNLGLFGAHQNAFEHKPWVESSLADRGVPGMGWTYVADEEQLLAQSRLSSGPLVLRRSRTSGGEGMVSARTAAEMVSVWPQADESFVSVAPYISGGIPLNIGATVTEGGIAVHHASVQLIGIPSCTTRPFGYCGNDFAAAQDLPDSVLDEVEASTRTIGTWLGRHGYRGSFGVDFLVKDGVPLFTEVNPRFQGSTAASARLSVEQGLPCLLMEHTASFLDVPLIERPPLRYQVRRAAPLAQVVVHWVGEQPAAVDAAALVDAVSALAPSCEVEAVVPEGCLVHPGATVARFVVRERLTGTGFDLAPAWDEVIAAWNGQALQGAKNKE